jgi:hypothetical protein
MLHGRRGCDVLRKPLREVGPILTTQWIAETQRSDLLMPGCVGRGCIVYIDNSLRESSVNVDSSLAGSDLTAVK